MGDNIREELDYIIEKGKIKSVFQPIISLRDGHILGYEALSRVTCQTLIRNTEELFQSAGIYNRLWDLELLCRMKSLKAANVYIKSPYDKKLFINVNPKVMHDKKFRDGFTKECLREYDIRPENIIFEITERNAIQDMDSFKAVINHYKKQQYQIAVDDAGAGYSGLNLISEIRPHYIKLDMNLIRNIDKDNVKYALVKSMLEFSHLTNINLIAEGIETMEELKVLVEMGVHYGQGYLIQKPDESMKEIDKNLIVFINELNKRNYSQIRSLPNLLIGNISSKSQVRAPFVKVEEVYNEFMEDSDINGLCVTDNDFVLGIITKESITLRICGKHGFSIFHKKPISAVMDTEFLSVDYYTPISTVSYLAMGRINKKLYDMIVVTKEGKYYGTVTVKDLLQKVTEIASLNDVKAGQLKKRKAKKETVTA
ncbi:EAL domain-containing protein [Anaerocolumna sp.]|uniref:EAL domain-containing protein n=1 Tax=Anaerocolumna sp. TaxID=2041569 RepID=UPI0028AB1C6F|nr:EAL domain-containing protein [Anaerocolumna sp.]